MEINDPLHLASYGIKRDYTEKVNHIVNDFYPNNPKRVFYPIDRHGVVDEWDALIKNQTYLEEQLARRKAEEDKYKKLQYKHDLEMMRKMKEDEKQRDKDRLKAERAELQYLDKEHAQYNKMRKSLDKQLKNQTAADLLNQIGNDKNMEDNLKQRELAEMKDKINQYQMGEQAAKINDLEKKAQQAKDMRDFLAYKEFQKDIEREKGIKDKMDYHRQVDDANRKQTEKDRQRRKFYEDFAHQQQGRISDYTQQVIAPHNERERMLEMKRLQDRNDIANQTQNDLINDLGKKAMSQAEIDDFNRRQLELKNQKEQQEKQKNMQYANQRANEIQMMENMTDQQKQDFLNQKKLYGQTLLYQQAVQDQLRRNYGKMTMNEKKLNKVDLTAYKNLEGQVYAIVPGIHHFDTVGSQPLAHHGAPQMDLEQAVAGRTQRGDFNGTIRDNNTTYKRKQQELEQKRNHVGFNMSPGPQNSQMLQTINMNGQQQPMSQSVDYNNQPGGMARYRSQTTLGDAANHFEITNKNPIWNPLPNYHRKLFNPITYQNNVLVPNSTKSVLQTMAHNNIFK